MRSLTGSLMLGALVLAVAALAVVVRAYAWPTPVAAEASVLWWSVAALGAGLVLEVVVLWVDAEDDSLQQADSK